MNIETWILMRRGTPSASFTSLGLAKNYIEGRFPNVHIDYHDEHTGYSGIIYTHIQVAGIDSNMSLIGTSREMKV